MIKHVTLWKLKDFACGNDKETNYQITKKMTVDLLKDFPKMIDAEVHRGFTVGNTRYDMCKIFTFANKEDLNEFLKSPVHDQYKKFNGEIREGNAVIDYDTEEE